MFSYVMEMDGAQECPVEDMECSEKVPLVQNVHDANGIVSNGLNAAKLVVEVDGQELERKLEAQLVQGKGHIEDRAELSDVLENHANGPDSNGENAQRAAEEEEGLDPDDKEEVDIAEGEQDTEEAATDKSVQLKSQQSLTRREPIYLVVLLVTESH